MATAELTPFQLHRQKFFNAPEISGELPKLLKKAKSRAATFLNRQWRKWKIKNISANVAASLMLLHQRKPGESRAVRDQRLHTDLQMILLFLSRLNVQPNHKDFSFLQILWISIEDICCLTGFSRSTVTASLARLTRAGLLRTKRRKNETRDREWVAVRWITPTLFEMLGLGSWLKKQKEGRQTRRSAPLATGTMDDEKLSATLARAQASYEASKPPDPPEKWPPAVKK